MEMLYIYSDLSPACNIYIVSVFLATGISH